MRHKDNASDPSFQYEFDRTGLRTSYSQAKERSERASRRSVRLKVAAGALGLATAAGLYLSHQDREPGYAQTIITLAGGAASRFLIEEAKEQGKAAAGNASRAQNDANRQLELSVKRQETPPEWASAHAYIGVGNVPGGGIE